jgi:hypothetical protein
MKLSRLKRRGIFSLASAEAQVINGLAEISQRRA